MVYYGNDDGAEAFVIVLMVIGGLFIVGCAIGLCCGSPNKRKNGTTTTTTTQTPIPSTPTAPIRANPGGAAFKGSENLYPVKGMFKTNNSRVEHIELGGVTGSFSTPVVKKKSSVKKGTKPVSSAANGTSKKKGKPSEAPPPSYNAPYHDPPNYK